MRTTLDLPDQTFRRLKSLAAQRGVPLKQVLRAAVQRELERANQTKKRHRASFPILSSRQPATLHLTNAEIDDLLA